MIAPIQTGQSPGHSWHGFYDDDDDDDDDNDNDNDNDDDNDDDDDDDDGNNDNDSIVIATLPCICTSDRQGNHTAYL